MERDLEKLLGGYVTGVLTEAERKALLAAALQNRALFDVLADEQALKELLDDPGSRDRLLDMLKQADRSGQRVERWRGLVPAWLHVRYRAAPQASASPPAWTRTSRWAIGGSMAVIVSAIVAVAWLYEEGALTPEPVVMADSRPGAGVQSGTIARDQAAPAAPPVEEDPSGPSARDRFYAFYARAEAPKQAGDAAERLVGHTAKVGAMRKPLQKPLGLRYGLVKRVPEEGDIEVDPAMVFSVDDALRLTVEVNSPGFLYVLKRIPPGIWSVVFPSAGRRPDQTGRDAYVEGRTRYVVPQAGSLIGPGQSGVAQVVIIFSREPRVDLTNLVASGSRQDSDRAHLVDFTAVVSRLRTEMAGGKLLIERVDPSHPDIPDEQAVYVVDQSPVPGSLLLTDLMVSHR